MSMSEAFREVERTSYERAELEEGRMLDDPLAELRVWLDAAIAARTVEPNAFCLATAALDGAPSARMVLLRGLDARGVVFYTNYESRKGAQLRAQSLAAATFWWGALERQVRLEGTVEPLSDEESDTYFASRPRGHRLSAWASEQSRTIESRALLDERMLDFETRFEGDEVPRPHSWGGFLIKPSRVEFWQGRKNRMHDRIEYSRSGSQWRRQRLQP